VVVRGVDRYGRTRGEAILPDGRNPNHELVFAALSWWYSRYAPADRTLGWLEKEPNQTLHAIVTPNHAAGGRMRPTIWPAPVLQEGKDPAFHIVGVASPDSGGGSDSGNPDLNGVSGD